MMPNIDQFADEVAVLNDPFSLLLSRLTGEFLNTWRKRHVCLLALRRGFRSPIRDACECPAMWEDVKPQWTAGVEIGYAGRIGAMALFVSVLGIVTVTQILQAGIF